MAEKEPIMQCRIADRGLLFGYLGNKMLSLYEDWREEREKERVYVLFFLENKPTLNECYLYIKEQNDNHEKGKGKRKN